MGIVIKGTGMYVPDRILTNADLEKMVETSDEWITTRTGIKQRHIADKGVATSDLACEAAKRALDMARVSPEELDLITVATVTPDKMFPNTAALVQRKLGAKACPCFDIEAACSGLLYSLEVGHSIMTAHKNYKKALVIGGEKLSSIVDWADRSTCVLFGDGAAALVLERDDSAPDFYVAGKLAADGNYGDILHLPAGGSAMPASHESVDGKLHFIKMGGQETFKLAVTNMSNACKEVLANAGIAPDQVSWVIPHQANHRIISAVAQRLTVPEDRVYVNIMRYGNTSSASIGICLDELNRAGKLKRGDYVLLTAFGGGLTWGAQLIRW